MKNGYVVLLSGGLDSAALLWSVIEQGIPVSAISFNYGQRHHRELYAAAQLARAASQEMAHHIVDLQTMKPMLTGSSLTDDSVETPEGHYEAEMMKATVVPNRNMVMLSIASAWAVAQGAQAVVFGAHAGDHAIYPDCREEFVEAMNEAVEQGNNPPAPIILAPFINMTKADIVKEAMRLKVPFHLTYSCYKGGERHCGKCGTCVERAEAFAANGLKDPAPTEEDGK